MLGASFSPRKTRTPGPTRSQSKRRPPNFFAAPFRRRARDLPAVAGAIYVLVSDEPISSGAAADATADSVVGWAVCPARRLGFLSGASMG